MTSYAFDFHQTLWANGLGPNRPMLQLAKDLLEAGHDVHIISHAANEHTIRNTRQRVRELGVRFTSVNVGVYGVDKHRIMREVGAQILIDDTPEVCAHTRKHGIDAIDCRKFNRDREFRIHRPERPNLIIMGTGRCGSSILAKMLHNLGWDWGNADHYGEHRTCRSINDRALHGRKIFSVKDVRRLLSNLRSPWLLKDPRFTWTLGKWKPLLPSGVMLVWITRDLKKTENSFRKQGWLRDGKSRGATVEELHHKCLRHFDLWNGPKLRLDFDDIKRAVSLFDTQRG